MSKLNIFLIVLGSTFGVVYWLLGLAASVHLKDKTANTSSRFVGASFYWSFEPSRYVLKGAKLCAWGNAALVIAAASWIAWFFYK